MPFNLGGPELIVILVIVLIVFGAGRLPNVMRDLGTGVREFKKAQTEIDSPATITSTTSTSPASSASPAVPAAPVAPVAPSTMAHTDTAPARPVESPVRA